MTLFVIYLALFLVLTWRGLFRNDQISSPVMMGFLLLKMLAVPVFYFAYERAGGIGRFDAGKFFHDAMILRDMAVNEPGEFVRCMSGFQNDQPGTAQYAQWYVKMQNWDNGRVKDFLYNDNRVVIRLHGILSLVSFRNYLVHALFSCFLAFTGAFLVFRALHVYYRQLHKWLFAILCFFPSLWFYTGGVLKEGPAMFILGGLMFLTSRLTRDSRWPLHLLFLLILLWCGFLLKPYMVLPLFAGFFVLMVCRKFIRKRELVIFCGSLMLLIAVAEFASRSVKGRTLLQAAEKQHRVFTVSAQGGIFLSGKTRYVRMDYDTTSVVRAPGATDSLYTIRRGVGYSYWEDVMPGDSLYNAYNMDTVTVFRLEDMSAPGRSNIPAGSFGSSVTRVLTPAFYYGMVYPLSAGMEGRLAVMASAENVLILLSLLVCLAGLFISGTSRIYLCWCILIPVGVCMLVSYTSPNVGAIMRYRAPVVIMIMAGALHVIDAAWKRDRHSGIHTK